jgi:hypothetical protein
MNSVVNKMMGLIHKKIAHLFIPFFHGTKAKFIRKALVKYKKLYPNIPTDVLENKLTLEANRIYHVVDRAILLDRIKRANYTLFFGLLVTVAVLVASFAIVGLPAVAPWFPLVVTVVVPNIFNYLIALFTIRVSYTQRVKGSMDSTMNTFNPHEKDSTTHMMDILNLIADIPNAPQEKIEQIRQSIASPALKPKPEPELELTPSLVLSR